jgi:hypothetical protein
MFTRRSEKIQSLLAIFKVRECSVHATHMSDCAVEHEIIVISSHCPHLLRGVPVHLGLGGWGGAKVLVVLLWPTAHMHKMVNMHDM